MDMDQAAVWLAGSILTTLGFIVLIAGAVVVNNILHKYWKPVRVFTADSWAAINPPHRFTNPEDLRTPPSLEPELSETTKSKK